MPDRWIFSSPFTFVHHFAHSSTTSNSHTTLITIIPILLDGSPPRTSVSLTAARVDVCRERRVHRRVLFYKILEQCFSLSFPLFLPLNTASLPHRCTHSLFQTPTFLSSSSSFLPPACTDLLPGAIDGGHSILFAVVMKGISCDLFMDGRFYTEKTSSSRTAMSSSSC